MKMNNLITGILFATLGITSCTSNNERKTKEPTSEQATESKSSPSTEIQLSIDEIDRIREEVESLKIQPIEVATSNLREKTKQKWSKIHFYVENGMVVKIKTYPYPEISKRTEEFYANKGGLVLVVIEDNGEGAKGKPKSEINKMYYFNNGKLIKELSNQEESEHAIKMSDAEELLSEFNEYIQIYNEKRK